MLTYSIICEYVLNEHQFWEYLCLFWDYLWIFVHDLWTDSRNLSTWCEYDIESRISPTPTHRQTSTSTTNSSRFYFLLSPPSACPFQLPAQESREGWCRWGRSGELTHLTPRFLPNCHQAAACWHISPAAVLGRSSSSSHHTNMHEQEKERVADRYHQQQSQAQEAAVWAPWYQDTTIRRRRLGYQPQHGFST